MALAADAERDDDGEPPAHVAAALAERSALQEQVETLTREVERLNEQSASSSPSDTVATVENAFGTHSMLPLHDLARSALFIALTVFKAEGSLGMTLTVAQPPPGSLQPACVSVKAVSVGGPADEAGIRAGDLVGGRG